MAIVLAPVHWSSVIGIVPYLYKLLGQGAVLKVTRIDQISIVTYLKYCVCGRVVGASFAPSVNVFAVIPKVTLIFIFKVLCTEC